MPILSQPRSRQKINSKKSAISQKCLRNLHLCAIYTEGASFFDADPAVIPAQLEQRQSGRLLLFQLWSSVDVDKTPRGAIENRGFVNATSRKPCNRSFMMIIRQGNSDSPRLTRIDTDGKNEFIPFLIRVIREIRGSIWKAQKYSNSRADADTVGPGAIKNRDCVSAAKKQPKMHEIQFIAPSLAAGGPRAVPLWPWPSARRIAAAEAGLHPNR